MAHSLKAAELGLEPVFNSCQNLNLFSLDAREVRIRSQMSIDLLQNKITIENQIK